MYLKNFLVISTLIIFSISIIPSSDIVSAQPNAPVGYEIGWDSVDQADEGFTLDEEGAIVLDYWIQNNYLWSITVELEYDLPFDASTSSEESIEIGAGENVSMNLAITGVDVLSNKAGLEKSLNINAGAYSAGQIPDPESHSISSTLIIPHITGFSLEIGNPPGAINSGGETQIDLTITNTGNDEDKITSPTAYHKQCPQLQIENLEALEGMTVSSSLDSGSGMKTHSITVVAPSSHPSKTCDVSIVIYSKSDSEKGISNPSDEDDVTVEIRKGTSGTSSDGSSTTGNTADGDSNDNPNDPDDVVTSNFAPSIGLIEVIMMLSIVAIKKRKW